MRKIIYLFFISFIILIFSAAIPTFAEKPAKKKPKKNFHGLYKGNIDALFTLEKLCPKLIKEWLIVKDLKSQIPELYATFGTKKRGPAEKKANSLIKKLNSQLIKYTKLHYEYSEEFESKLHSITKKINRLEKKKKLSTFDEKKLVKLEQTAADLKDSIKALERIRPRSYLLRPPTPIQRLGISAGELAGKQIIEDAPKFISLRMCVQDCVTDIKALRKNNDQHNAANKEKQLLKKLKTTYNKMMIAAQAYEKKLNTKLAKSQKELDKVEKKIEQLEKSNRNTEKYDKKRIMLMGDIRTINFQLQLVDQLLACPKAKKMLNIK